MEKVNILKINKNKYIVDLKDINHILDNGLNIIEDNDNKSEIYTPVILEGKERIDPNLFNIKNIIFKSESDKKIVENTWGNNDKFQCSLIKIKNIESKILDLNRWSNTNYIQEYNALYDGSYMNVNMDINDLEDNIKLKLVVEDRTGKVIKTPELTMLVDDNSKVNKTIKKYNMQFGITEESYKFKIYLNDRLSIEEYISKLINK